MFGSTALAAVLCLLLCGLNRRLEASVLNCIPRKSVLHQNGSIKTFEEEGFFNYSTMLVREDVNTLLVGAREAVYALNMDDISERISTVYWPVLESKQQECTNKGKNKDTECRNYIRTLNKIGDAKMYVCGTNAFSPTCAYMTFNKGQLLLENNSEESKGKCPFDPFQRYASVMVEDDLYAATSINFLGSEPVVIRNSGNSLRTEFKDSWLNEPNFIYMDVVQESQNNADGDDDKVYLFFSETAVEYDFYNKLLVSRIARVCKGDLGGQRTLQKKWTTFLKASLVCSVLELNVQLIVQDVFVLKSKDWRDTIFYGVFIPQLGALDISAVCAYTMNTVQDVFSKGKYKAPVTVESSHVKWVMYSGEVPVPRPGACINNQARAMGINHSLDLPDKTLQFVRDHPLMDDSVTPIGGQPRLVKRGSLFSRIVVDRVTALDGKPYDVMFIGTENGFLQKAVNFDGEMFIIEEVQLFQPPESVQSLTLSSKKGQVYAGSSSRVVQMPFSVCRRYDTCLGCVLARDPYCAWDLAVNRCAATAGRTAAPQNFIQSVGKGDASSCPELGNIKTKKRTFIPGSNIQLKCSPISNLAQIHWTLNGSSIQLRNPKYYAYDGGILLFNVAVADAGQYTCQSVEQANGKQYQQTMAVYSLEPEQSQGQNTEVAVTTQSPGITRVTPTPPVVPDVWNPKIMLHADDKKVLFLKIFVGILACLLVCLLTWNLCKGHMPLPCVKPKMKEASAATPRMVQIGGVDTTAHQVSFNARGTFEASPMVNSQTGTGVNSWITNNNNAAQQSKDLVDSFMIPSTLLGVDDFRYIDEESEI
ncbi:semaphorin-4E-like [Polyodon spathula]|uniref:semaphorin-4E-like n=1 Tax=Polyodon spathula TaxID=7913 RepID=UPI001B7EF94E|nr:semaphorin-4E-like [Polyodon spathula]XP_041086107.1 semaphorin-4E-like [Polyodon spathula]XP_041086108.1 semaphorin-4E-like [Polyodon spathula]